MIRFRNISVVLAVLSVAACAPEPMQIRTTAQYEANPLGFSQNPTMTKQLSQTYITNELELASAAERIEAEMLEPVDDSADASLSARSNISLF